MTPIRPEPPGPDGSVPAGRPLRPIVQPRAAKAELQPLERLGRDDRER